MSRAATPGLPLGATAVFRRQNTDYWTISYEGEDLLLRDAKGLHYLARLLAHPGEQFEASELAAVAPPEGNAERARSAVTKRIKDAIHRIAAQHAGLGYHLGTAIHTGARCRYEPDPTRPVRWTTVEEDSRCTMDAKQ